ncbi:MAG: GAF domain-containing protein [Chloroflexi bacterium]|nr:MAG: GAF domain-containing protein [Chloroflexota bacterium]
MRKLAQVSRFALTALIYSLLTLLLVLVSYAIVALLQQVEISTGWAFLTAILITLLLAIPLLIFVRQQLVYLATPGLSRFQERLLPLVHRLHRHHDLDTLLDEIVTLLDETLSPYFSALLITLHPDRPLEVVRQSGPTPPEIGPAPPDDSLLHRILQHRRALFLVEEKLPDSSLWRKWCTLDITWVVPLILEDRLIGLLLLGPPQEGNQYGREAIEWLNALADQIAIAIHNAHQYTQALDRLDELNILFEAGAAVSNSLDPDEIRDIIATRLMTAFQADGCIISQWEPQNQTLIIHLVRLPQDKTSLVPSPGSAQNLDDFPLAAKVLQERQTVAIAMADSPERAGQVPLLRTGLMSAVLLLPLVSRDDTVGLVELYTADPHRTFSEQEMDLAQALVNQAATAIANAHLYQQEVRRTEELTALLRIQAIIASILDIRGALALIADQMVRILNVAGCRVSSWDQDRDQVISWLDHHLPNAPWTPGPLGTVYHLDDRPDFRQALESRAPIAVTLPTADHPPTALGPDTMQTYLILPLVARDEVIGLIELGAHRPQRVFSEWEIKLGQTLAQQAAVAIENARLYEELRIERRNLERKVDARTAELAQAVHALEVEASKRQAILESVADGVLVTDVEGRVILFNAAAEQLLDQPREKVVGHTLQEIIHQLDLDGAEWEAAFQRWVHAQADSEMDYVEQKAVVGERTLSIRLSPVHMGPRFLGVVAIFHDITKEVELNRAKSEFVSTVSHELRLPMTSIKGYTDLLILETAGPLTDQQREFLKIIKSNADRLSLLVNDLLDISRMETGRLKLDIGPFAIGGIIAQIVNAFQERAEAKQISLSAQVPADLPLARGDPRRIEQVLTNLVGNAINYTPEGGSVTIQVRSVGDYLQVDVADTGIGIPPEEQEKIWERFYRVDHPLVTRQIGTGLGLPIVKSLVEMHGGEVWLESAVGEGSTFSFTLPIWLDEPSTKGGGS